MREIYCGAIKMAANISAIFIAPQYNLKKVPQPAAHTGCGHKKGRVSHMKVACGSFDGIPP